MIRTNRRIRLLAAGLSALAGFVDATGFLNLGGFFVSFMSGNTTRFAVGLAQGAGAAAIAGGLIALFVLGVIVGTLLGHVAGKPRAPVLIGFVAALLALAAACGMAGLNTGAVVAMTLAMGAENAIFAEGGEVHIGLTYMTGTLVKLGQHLASALLGGKLFAWWPYFILWLGLASGAIAGALLYPHLGLNGLWLASLAAAILAMVSVRTQP